MHIERVDVGAFGPLAETSLELAPGLTVVWGGNETGKSTWHAALFAGLCGIRRGPGKTTEQRDFEEAHRPWEGDGWQVTASVVCADGRQLQLRHDLDHPAGSRIVDAVTGHDLTAELASDGGPDGATLLGLTRKTLPHTIMVRQAEMLACTEGSSELQHALQQAAATGEDAATAEEAIGRIRKFHRERVGSEQARTRPLAKALAELDRCRGAHESAVADHQAYAALRAERDRAAEQAAGAEAEEARLQAERQRRELAAQVERLAEAEELAAQLPHGEPPDPYADDEIAEAVAQARSRWQARPSAPDEPDGEDAETLRAQLAALPEAPQGDVEPAAEVEQAAVELDYARRDRDRHQRRRPAEPPAAPVDADPHQLREVAETLAHPTPAVDPELATRVTDLQAEQAQARRRRTALGAAAAAVAAVGAGMVAASPGLGALLLLAAVGLGVAAVAAGRTGPRDALETARAELAAVRTQTAQASAKRQDAEARAAAWDLPAEPAHLRQLAADVETARDGQAHKRQWQAEAEELDETVRAAEERLRERLTERDAPADPMRTGRSRSQAGAARDIDEMLRAYERACAKRAEQARVASRRDDLRARLVARERAERQVTEQRHRRHECAGELLAAGRRVVDEAEDGRVVASDLQEAPATDPDALGRLEAALGEWLQAHRARQRQRLRQQQIATRLRSLLDGADLESLRARVAEARGQYAATVARLGGGEAALADLAEVDDRWLHDRLAKAASDAQEARKLSAELAGELRQWESTMQPVAQAEEALAAAQREVDRLRHLDRVMGFAVEHLQTASDRINRSIAPRLKETVERWLPDVTAGRYREVAVDPETLQVTVATPEAGWQPAGGLSHGTTEQIYLLLRVALAEHLVTTDEPAPLLLDDVTVQSDDERTVAILSLLAELAAERQIVLFSQEAVVRDWARDNLAEPGQRLVELAAVAAG